MMTAFLISACAFIAICLISITIFRMREIRSDSSEINKRLEFWLSELDVNNQLENYTAEKQEKDKTFTERILIPLGEQVGKWMSEKIPYKKQSVIRKQLIAAGYRDKTSIQVFYSVKILLAVALGMLVLFLLSASGKEIRFGFILPIGGGIIGYILANIMLDKQVTKRQKLIDGILPDALDLLVICTEAGMGIDQSLLRVAANLGEKGKSLTEEIVLTNREINLGQDRALCWSNMGERTASEELKTLARIITQSEKVGASIANVLRNQSEFLRTRKRQKAEETAAQMAVKMMIPLALFIFPCIMAVTLGPPILKISTTFK